MCSYLPPTDRLPRASSVRPFEMCEIRTGRRSTVPAHDRFYRGRRCLSQETTMLHVYGWRRDGGPFFLDNPRTLEDGIDFAETV